MKEAFDCVPVDPSGIDKDEGLDGLDTYLIWPGSERIQVNLEVFLSEFEYRSCVIKRLGSCSKFTRFYETFLFQSRGW